MIPHEWARFQRFSESFGFLFVDIHRFKPLGNSVTVSAIKAIAEQMMLAPDGKSVLKHTVMKKSTKDCT